MGTLRVHPRLRPIQATKEGSAEPPSNNALAQVYFCALGLSLLKLVLFFRSTSVIATRPNPHRRRRTIFFLIGSIQQGVLEPIIPRGMTSSSEVLVVETRAITAHGTATINDVIMTTYD